MSSKYNSMSVVQLRQIVKERGLKNTSSLRKAQLVTLLDQLDGDAPQTRTQLKEEEPAVDASQVQEPVPDGVSAAVTLDTGAAAVPEDNASAESTGSETAAVPAQPVRRQGQAARRRTADTRRTDQPGSSTISQGRGGYSSRQNQRRQSTQSFQPSQPGQSSQDRQNTQGFQPAQDRQGIQSAQNGQNIQESQNGQSPQNQRGFQTGQTRWQNQPGRTVRRPRNSSDEEREVPGFNQLDSGNMANGILEVLPDGYGFIRCENYLPGDNDVYVSHAQIRRFNLKTGDIVSGNIRVKNEKEKFSALLYVRTVNGFSPEEAQKRCNFEDMTPIFPNQKIDLETPGAPVAMRLMNLISPIGKGQRGMIVSPPKTGKTTLIKQVAKAVHTNYPEMNMIILLIDERPEEVTDIKEYIEDDNVEVIYSTFDELPEHHERVSEMVLERAKRLVEHKQDVVILLDSITRLARACNLTVSPSGRTLTGGLDPAALYMPKRFFGSARNMREGGSLTVLATALVETGSKMDDVVFEEFKGTGNMELVLDRRLSDRRIFPAINVTRSGTRREDLLLSQEEIEAIYSIRRTLNGAKSDESYERLLEMFKHTRSNQDFLHILHRSRFSV